MMANSFERSTEGWTSTPTGEAAGPSVALLRVSGPLVGTEGTANCGRD